jgi:hypothetical protein
MLWEKETEFSTAETRFRGKEDPLPFLLTPYPS